MAKALRIHRDDSWPRAARPFWNHPYGTSNQFACPLLNEGGFDHRPLVQSLLKSIDGSGLKKVLDALLAEEGFTETVRFASIIACQKGDKEISPEHLVAGAFFAYRRGLQRTRPAVCAHLAANEPSVKALIETRGWTLDGKPEDAGMLPLAPSVENALKGGDDESDPLMVALNAGIQPGSDILFKKELHIMRPDTQ